MRIFSGLSRSDYQDVLRSIGLYIDEHKLTNVRIIETENGLILQGSVVRDDTSREARDLPPQTYLLTWEDIETMLHLAYARRRIVPELNALQKS